MSLFERFVTNVVAAVFLMLAWPSHAAAYVGPGAGSGTRSSLTIANILVFVLAATVGLCVLCSVIGLVATGIRRLRARARP